MAAGHNIREYAQAVRAAVKFQHGDVDVARLEAWQSWAFGNANQIDPDP